MIESVQVSVVHEIETNSNEIGQVCEMVAMSPPTENNDSDEGLQMKTKCLPIYIPLGQPCNSLLHSSR